MIPAVLADTAFLADVLSARADQEHFHLWWLGQSGFLLQWQGRHLLLDPYLSDSLTKKYARTDKPHVRMTELVVAPERLDFIDVATSSHNHTDHLDAETLVPLLRVNPALTMIVPAANRTFAAERLGVAVERLTASEEGKPLQAAGFSFTSLPAAHETIERDEQGQCRYVGYVVRFGRWAIYHSGDTVLYEGMVERLAAERIDVGFCPSMGVLPNAASRGIWMGRKQPLWLTARECGSSSPATTNCSSSTRLRPISSPPQRRASANPTDCSAAESDGQAVS